MLNRDRSGLPPKATPVLATATVGAASNNQTLAAALKRINYCIGFSLTGGGATAASVITVTLAGLVGGTMTFSVAIPAGATAQTRFDFFFPFALPATDENIAIVLTVPSYGAGNTAATALLLGFKAERP